MDSLKTTSVGSADVVEALVTAFALVSTTTPASTLLEAANADGCTALHVACKSGRRFVAEVCVHVNPCFIAARPFTSFASGCGWLKFNSLYYFEAH